MRSFLSTGKKIIAMIHVDALPGTPRHTRTRRA
jgi:predicted TIM-barrel enzyme